MDSQQLQQATSNPNIQRVLQKQASLGKRFSAASTQQGVNFSSMRNSNNKTTPLQPNLATASRLNTTEQPQSYSHTETAV